ncbi:MAG: hypothetical protein K2X47_11395, partial [Bdellovibrionales bacterium]|nr:hypothetical protein [Bdellovibrionales bacterium]
RDFRFAFPPQPQAFRGDSNARQRAILDVVSTMLARVGKFDPRRKQLYQNWASSFFAEANISNFPLKDIPDSDHTIYPSTCQVIQLVVHQEPSFREDFRYNIFKPLWDLMDINHQAATILHELEFREAITMGHENSILVRYFGSKMLSTKHASMTIADYIQLVRETKLIGGQDRIAGVNGEEYAIPRDWNSLVESFPGSKSLVVGPDGQVSDGMPIQKKAFSSKSQMIFHAAGSRFETNRKEGFVSICPADDQGDGKIEQVALEVGEQRVFVHAFEADANQPCEKYGVSIDFQGNIVRARAQKGTFISTAYGKLEFTKDIEFFPSGKVKRGTFIWRGGPIRLADGTVEKLGKGFERKAFFNEQGMITRWSGVWLAGAGGGAVWMDER